MPYLNCPSLRFREGRHLDRGATANATATRNGFLRLFLRARRLLRLLHYLMYQV